MRPESEKEDSGRVWMMPEGAKSGPGRGAGKLERSNGVICLFVFFIEFAAILLLCSVLDFGHEARGILAPRPGIEPHPLH